MRKYGFKIFTTNLQTAPALIKECADFAVSKEDMFLELMVIPESSEDDLREIRKITENLEVRIHAPHHKMGFDASDKDLESSNIKILSKAQKAADIFNSETIVVHAGRGYGMACLEENIRQFRLFHDSRIVVENLPFIAGKGKAFLGNTADDIKCIMAETGCGFCFDFSHAICAALALNVDVDKQLKDFFALNPNVYHMCDGDISKAQDQHMHFKTGNYPLKYFLNDLTDSNAYITMETGQGVLQHNDLWIKDYQYLKSLED